MDRGAWKAAVHTFGESDTTEAIKHAYTNVIKRIKHMTRGKGGFLMTQFNVYELIYKSSKLCIHINTIFKIFKSSISGNDGTGYFRHTISLDN